VSNFKLLNNKTNQIEVVVVLFNKVQFLNVKTQPLNGCGFSTISHNYYNNNEQTMKTKWIKTPQSQDMNIGF